MDRAELLKILNELRIAATQIADGVAQLDKVLKEVKEKLREEIKKESNPK